MPSEKKKRRSKSASKDDDLIGENLHNWLARSGGLSGGWSNADHNCMTTMTHRHANWRRKPEKFIDDVWSGVKGVTSREAVKKHVDWYIEYCWRRDREKKKIEIWRKCNEESKEKEREERERKLRHEKMEMRRCRSRSCSSLAMVRKQHKLEEWRTRKQVKKEIEEAEELLRMAEKRAKIEASIRKRNKKNRANYVWSF